MNICKDITEVVGRTPLVRLNRVSEDIKAKQVLLKMESQNPLSSVKDRIGRAMIEAAEADGRLKPGGMVIEPTSGNTGIALAFVCAAKGYPLILTMPESMSMERRHLLSILGAMLELTPAEKGMPGAIARAAELVEENPGAFMPQQFNNPANPEIHYTTTGEEIYNDTDGEADVIVAGVGTGGTISGVSRYMKSKKDGFLSIAVEPKGSPVLSGGSPGPHKIQGIGAGFQPDNYHADKVDEVVTITEDEAGAMARRLAREEGILVGISAAGNVHAAIEVAKRDDMAGKTIVTVACDTGERYLTTWLYENERFQG